MRTMQNAKYQLTKIMPIAKQRGCDCHYDEADFDNFVAYEWHHELGCLAPLYECLPNARGLFAALAA